MLGIDSFEVVSSEVQDCHIAGRRVKEAKKNAIYLVVLIFGMAVLIWSLLFAR